MAARSTPPDFAINLTTQRPLLLGCQLLASWSPLVLHSVPLHPRSLPRRRSRPQRRTVPGSLQCPRPRPPVLLSVSSCVLPVRALHRIHRVPIRLSPGNLLPLKRRRETFPHPIGVHSVQPTVTEPRGAWRASEGLRLPCALPLSSINMYM